MYIIKPSFVPATVFQHGFGAVVFACPIWVGRINPAMAGLYGWISPWPTGNRPYNVEVEQ